MDKIGNLYDLCETLNREIQKVNAKIAKASGELTSGDLEYVDRLTHSLKSVKATIAMMKSEEYSNDGSYDDSGSYRRYSRDGHGSYDGSYDGISYTRGRGRYAKRDSMGRYSSDGYSRHGSSMIDELRALTQDAPDERTRQEMQRLINKMETV